jgi:hypothetical protein
MSTGGGSKSGLSLDTTLVNLEAAWRERVAESAVLEPTSPTMAIASRVYALEIGLKVLVCKKLGLSSLPKHCMTHDLNEIMIFTGLHPELNDPVNVGLLKNWDEIARFSRERLNDLRYAPNAFLSPAELAKLGRELDDSTEGVWSWLSSRL